jgi:hypothetical protein
MGCEGGDSPEVQGTAPPQFGGTFKHMSEQEREDLFNGAPGAGEAAEAAEAAEATPMVQHSDSGQGLSVARPDLKAAKYDTQPAEQIRDGGGHVLDAKWTAGGRLPGREHIEQQVRPGGRAKPEPY